MLEFKTSKEIDIDELNIIAIASEGYWSHSRKMMDIFKKEYELTEAYFRNSKIFNMILDGEIIGFYAVNLSQNIPELDYFYLKPEYIGKGYGRKLWNGVIKFCKEYDIKEFVFNAGPEVKNFYLKMGAKPIETLTSKLDIHRKIYKFKMKIE